MVECKYCDEEFDSKEEMHLHWNAEHSDELSSHDKDKVKKAKRKQNEEKQAKMQWRKKMLMRGVGGVVAIGVLYLAAPAILNLFSAGSTIDYDDLDLENQPMLGEEDAEISVVEFGDYRCPACKSFEDTVKPQLMSHIEEGDVNLYYLDFPATVPPSSHSENAAIAAQCVYEQDEDEFWNMLDALFANQQSLRAAENYADEDMISLAESSTEGLNYDELATCIENDETRDSVERDLEVARDNGVSATPTLYVNGDRVASQGNLIDVVESRLD